MAAQDELKAVFAELDRSTDRALAGLARVRSDARLERPQLPSPLVPMIAEGGLVLALAATLVHLGFSAGN
ncbi:hypothetical protein [Pannonibacter tanglangensis]|uniref:DUF3618 domain-containing protein n=1 Tax=Pannonibacter tanglangensis TaxID=2750084 RepID=A0ABW9ZCD6_9HYPH|nr:hypothetical protein [Pannonibacter sp. XCT-34]NBN62479.1 hypothetical protein [Pannonibacter sp. XCT-34]